VKTKTGKRSARISVQIVEDGGTIEMFFVGHDLVPISFKSKDGRSGPNAYEKLLSIIDKEEPRPQA
jgi:hypothetical protein